MKNLAHESSTSNATAASYDPMANAFRASPSATTIYVEVDVGSPSEVAERLGAEAAAYKERVKVATGAPDADPEVRAEMQSASSRRSAGRRAIALKNLDARTKNAASKIRYDEQRRRFRRLDARLDAPAQNAIRLATTIRRGHHTRARRAARVRTTKTVARASPNDPPPPEPEVPSGHEVAA